MAKAGINQHLEVTVDYPLTNVSKIEFLFRQVNNMNGAVYKMSVYDPQDAKSDVVLNGDNIFLVPFTSEDTYMFKQNSPFYMDTKIYLSNSVDNPETDIQELFMNHTLFRSENNG